MDKNAAHPRATPLEVAPTRDACPMLIVCPSCESRYRIADAAVGEAGRAVRCARCRTVWTAMPETAEAAPTGEPIPGQPAPGREAADGTKAEADGEIMQAERRVPAPAADPAVLDIAAEERSVREEPSARPASALRTSRRDKTRKAPKARGRRAGARRLPGLVRLVTRPACMGAIVVAALAAAVPLRAEVVRHLPATAALYARLGLPVNLRGLAFEDVAAGLEAGSPPMLAVTGTIHNVAGHAQAVPMLRVALRDASGAELYGWTAAAPRPLLEAGGATPFRVRLKAPPAGAGSVAVRFVRPDDATGAPPVVSREAAGAAKVASPAPATKPAG